MVGRAAAVLAAALLACLVVYDAIAGSLPNLPLWWDVALTAGVLVPATFALVLLGLPLRERRGLLPVGLAVAVLAAALELGSFGIPANYAKLAAVTLLAWWFLGWFEQLSWVVVVAAVIPLVDSLSVWRGPTRHIVEEEPQVFGALSVAFPVPDAGSFELGLPDVLFFALFLAAAERWSLRVGWTWLALTASFGVTMALAIGVDPFGIGGLPALPLLSAGFLGPNADLLWRRLRPGPVRVAGVDGCRGGWAVVELEDGRFAGASVVRSLAELRELPVRAIGVDVPIGLPVEEPRPADVAARAELGRAASSVFLTFPREVLEADTHAEAVERARSLGWPGISVQSFGQRRRIFEAESVAREDERVIEVHPELSFRALGDVSRSKRTPEGIAERRRALAAVGIELPDELARVPLGDALDAAAAAWSADRYARGEAEPLPPGADGRIGAIWR